MSSQNLRPEDRVNARKFSSMSLGEKVTHVGKVLVFLITFGFAFPNIFSE